MTLWAVVPVKPFRLGKSRLADVMDEDERLALNRSLLSHTLDVLHSVPDIEQILVVSQDMEALVLAQEHGARIMIEQGAPQLNQSLMQASEIISNTSAREVLVIPADLPKIKTEDILSMIALANDPPVVVIAPDRHRQGTNGLLVSPVGLIPYRFGCGSFQQHCELVKQAGARLEICDNPSLSLDVDLPEDLELASQELYRICGLSIHV